MSQYIIDQPAEQGPATPAPVPRVAKAAVEFGEANTCFAWGPYLPIGDYTVAMADGGTGKTIWSCGVAAAISTGRPLPEDDNREHNAQNVLILSAEDGGEILRTRLQASGADLNRVFILDCKDSQGMNIVEKYPEFEVTVLSYKPGLIIIDPWHAFLGPSLNLNKVNAVRPILQRFTNLAKKCNCAIVLISHVNKRAQGENANNAATGSTDFINAARSAVRIIFDDDDENVRLMVHTKSNYAASGPTIRYRITADGGVEWIGTSEITRWTLEEAARRRTTPREVTRYAQVHDMARQRLVEALETSASESGPTRFSYSEFKQLHGDSIFGGKQPARVMKAVAGRLKEDGYILDICSVRRNGKTENGFLIQRDDVPSSKQILISQDGA